MSTIGPDRAREIFYAAVDLPAAERATFLDQTCGGDAVVRAEVESLLAADERAGETPAQRSVAPGEPSAGATIGPYTLLELIGEGGFGQVWRAQQTLPIAREVALKLLKPEMGSRQVIARFDAERDAIAIMDHPGIAKVFDAGVTVAGRPYFVMELVRGVPLTQYCDQERLDLTQRMKLFVHICLAVQHAHGKGVIHRDLKPSNVLVTEVDGKPVPKIIDFGVAKATAADATRRQFFTEFRQLLGTPEYMSPEQASMASNDVDTRSDIYSLGVILYELLVGETPLDAHRLRDATYDEMQRLIREVDPPRPSTRLSQNRDTRASVAAVRRIEPGTLARRLRGELDWIVMKCLEKRRSRRYATSAALAEDVTAYLDGRPIAAAPPSVIYSFSKFIRRHRVVATVATTVAASVLLGLAGITYQYLQTRKARDEAIRNQLVAEVQRRESEAQRAVAEASGRFLIDMLASANPDAVGRKDVTVQEVADRALADLEKQTLGQPIVEATIRSSLATTYIGLARHETAAIQAEKAVTIFTAHLGGDHAETLKAKNNLATALTELNRLDDSERLNREILEKRRRFAPQDEALILLSANNLGQVLVKMARLRDAEPLLVEAYEGRQRLLGENHRLTLASGVALCNLYLWLGKYQDGEVLCRHVLELRRRVFGDEDQATAQTMQLLANLLMRQRHVDEAEVLLRQAVPILKRTIGEDHPDTLDAQRNLATALRRLKRHAEAESVITPASERANRLLGRDHPDAIRIDSVRLQLLIDAKRDAQIVALGRELLERGQRAFGVDHPDTIALRSLLASALRSTGDLQGAETELRQVASDRTRVLGAKHSQAMQANSSLADLLLTQGKINDAAELQRKLYEQLDASNLPASQSAAIALNYGRTLVQLRRFSDAEGMLQDAVARAQAGGAEQTGTAAEAVTLLVHCARETGDEALAQRRQSELEALKATTQPSTAPAATTESGELGLVPIHGAQYSR